MLEMNRCVAKKLDGEREALRRLRLQSSMPAERGNSSEESEKEKLEEELERVFE